MTIYTVSYPLGTIRATTSPQAAVETVIRFMREEKIKWVTIQVWSEASEEFGHAGEYEFNNPTQDDLILRSIKEPSVSLLVMNPEFSNLTSRYEENNGRFYLVGQKRRFSDDALRLAAIEAGWRETLG